MIAETSGVVSGARKLERYPPPPPPNPLSHRLPEHKRQ